MICEYNKFEVTPGLAGRSPVPGLGITSTTFKHYVAPEIDAVLRHLFDGGKLSESPSQASTELEY